MKKVLIGILIGLIVGVGCLFVYNEFFVKKDNTTKTDKKEAIKTEVIKEENLDVNSDLVQELASNLLIGETSMLKIDFSEQFKEKNKLTSNDLPQEFKNYLGYRQLPNSQIESAMCRDYPSVLYSKTKHLCGGGFYDQLINDWDDTNSETKIIKENNLKLAVEKIFGENSYNKVNGFDISGSRYNSSTLGLGYLYDQSNKVYVYFEDPVGGTGPVPTVEIEGAKKTGDNLFITEKIYMDIEEYKIDLKLKYTFKLENGNYYFESVEKIN